MRELDDVDGRVRQRLRAMRQALGWSQSEMAQRITRAGRPMHQTTVAKLESRGRPLPLDELEIIARVLDTTVAVLVEPGGEDDELLQRLGRLRHDISVLRREANEMRANADTLVEVIRDKEREHEALLRELAARGPSGEPGETS